MQNLRRYIRFIGAMVAVIALASGCVTQGQNRYSYRDVGQTALVEFGTVVASRQVEIQGKNTGTGALVGGAVGAGAGSYIGSGSGSAWGVGAGLLAGALAGAIAEQSMADRFGIEYVITLANGKTVTLVQEQAQGDRVFNPGDAVMVQSSGTYQRVLAADHLPSEIKRPKQIKIVD